MVMYMVDYKLIGSRIKKFREQKGLTQERVAESVGITSVYLSKIENGKVHPTLDTLSVICDVLSCDLGALLLYTASESDQYENERVVKLFRACSANVKPIAIQLLDSLSKI